MNLEESMNKIKEIRESNPTSKLFNIDYNILNSNCYRWILYKNRNNRCLSVFEFRNHFPNLNNLEFELLIHYLTIYIITGNI